MGKIRIISNRPARDENMMLIPDMKYFGFTGTSLDTKPTSVVDGNTTISICTGSYFLETDTGIVKFFDEDTGEWN